VLIHYSGAVIVTMPVFPLPTSVKEFLQQLGLDTFIKNPFDKLDSREYLTEDSLKVMGVPPAQGERDFTTSDQSLQVKDLHRSFYIVDNESLVVKNYLHKPFFGLIQLWPAD
jgi:hypothetical protein